MKHKQSYNIRFLIFVASTLCILAFTGSQFFVAWEYKKHSQAIEQELMTLKITKIDEEKTRQEIIKLRLENEQQALFFRTLIVNLGSSIGIIVTLSGAWVGLNQYFASRRREQLDRLANDLNKLWDGLTDSDDNIRAGSIAGLQHFLSPEKKEFHSRVASALALVGRLDDNSLVVQRTLTPVIECAMREMTDVMRSVSWQGLKLDQPNFSELDLSDFDFRDCNLRNANFRGTNLSNTRCNNANFSGGRFDDAILHDANLEYVDFANASLKNADLKRANLNNVKIIHMDLQKAKLIEAKFLDSAIDWRLSKNWRSAEFDYKLKQSLIRRYGPDINKPRVLMLLWEFLPVVSGGAWTAAYHLLKNLRMKGTDLIVMVPWPPSAVSHYEFGNELELIPVGIEQNGQKDIYSVYESSTQLPFNSQLYDSEIKDSPSIFDRVNEFTKRVCKVVEEKNLKFDVIHAHDWVTFVAAESLAKKWNKPWVSHFHSIEADRQNIRLSSSVNRIEQRACQEANHIIIPSNFTKQRLIDIYQASEGKMTVSPNCLSDEDNDDKVTSGDFQSFKIIFVGRITWQKGPDIFLEIAKEVLQIQPNVNFVIFGKGDMENDLHQSEDYIEVYTPEPEIVQSTKGDETRFTYKFIEFKTMVPINYIVENDSIEVLRDSLTDKTRLQFEKFAFERGFTAYAGKFDYPYTHRIVINDLGDNLHTDYLVAAEGLRQARRTVKTKKLVSIEGFRDWNKRKKMFENATLVIVPSRFEPFGMVVLEAMQEGVPVMYSKNAGVAEVISSGISINQENVKEVSQQIISILRDKTAWQSILEAQTSEIRNYQQRQHENIIINIWKLLAVK